MEALRETILVFRRYSVSQVNKMCEKTKQNLFPFSSCPPPCPLPKQKDLCPCYRFLCILFWRFLPGKLHPAYKFLATDRFSSLGICIVGSPSPLSVLLSVHVDSILFINKISLGSRPQPTTVFLLIAWSSLVQKERILSLRHQSPGSTSLPLYHHSQPLSLDLQLLQTIAFHVFIYNLFFSLLCDSGYVFLLSQRQPCLYFLIAVC